MILIYAAIVVLIACLIIIPILVLLWWMSYQDAKDHDERNILDNKK